LIAIDLPKGHARIDCERGPTAYNNFRRRCSWFTEGFDTADLKDAKALLDELNRNSG